VDLFGEDTDDELLHIGTTPERGCGPEEDTHGPVHRPGPPRH
jgi:hypothetical protein